MTLKVGILGAADIARKICRAMSFTDRVEVVAVGSRDLAKSQAFVAECSLSGKAAAYGSYNEVLEDPNVDAVYIPLPTSLHVEWVRKAAAKKKHVMLEKPIALTPEDTDAIVGACQQAGVQLMDGTMWSHNPRTVRMEAAMGNQEVFGEVQEVTAIFSFMGSEEFFRSNVRVRADCDALGCFDVGWYCVRAILWAFNFEVPIAVAAHAGAVFNEAGVPMHIGGTVIFSGGRRGNFSCGFDRALTQFLEVAGTRGTVQLNDFVIPRHEKKCAFIATSNHGLRDMDTWDATQRDEIIISLEKPQEVYQWEAFAACVERIRVGGVPEDRWVKLAALTQKVCCAVLESARQGCRQLPFEP